MTEGSGSRKPPEAPSSEDWYINSEGLLVFTAAYHLKRGYCCKNGCLHCPYGFKSRGSGIGAERPDLRVAPPDDANNDQSEE